MLYAFRYLIYYILQVRSLNFAAIIGSGILHTKLWLIDRTHFYVGSANMDWRSLTQVKELGIVAFNCSCMANDLAKIFDVSRYKAKCHSLGNGFLFWILT